MKRNMSLADRVFRVLLVTVAVVLLATHIIPATAGWIVFASSAIFLATSLIGYCPIYGLAGLTTRKKDSHPKAV